MIRMGKSEHGCGNYVVDLNDFDQFITVMLALS